MYIKHTAAVSILMLSLILSTSTNAQDTLGLRSSKVAATNTFLDKSQNKAARLKAIEGMGYPEKETFARLIALSTDKTEDSDIRLAAVKKHRYDDVYFNTVMALIADPAEPPALKAGVIKDVGQRTTFRMPAEIRQRLQSTLRGRLDDSAQIVRLAAFRVLVPAHDMVAVDKLVEGLRSGNNIVPAADGIELLDVDGSGKHLTTIRPFLTHNDPRVQAQAARALANDPQSRGRVVELATNISANSDVRKNALRGLAREDDNFMRYAIAIIVNPRESADMRYEAMKNGMGRMNYQKVADSMQVRFAQAIERVAGGRPARTSDGKELTAEAKVLLAHLRRTFPPVGRFFKLRR